MSDIWDAAPLSKAPAVAGGWDAAPAAGPTPQQRVTSGANDNADEAAQALKLSKQTKVPPTVVQSDLPGYTQSWKAQSAIQHLDDNPFISKYVSNVPLAASVSSDDYDNLNNTSQSLQELHPDRVDTQVRAGLLYAIPNIYNLASSAAGRDKLYNALTQLPGALLKGVGDFFTLPGRVASGEVDLSTSEGLDEAISFGVGVAIGGGRIRVGRPIGLEGVPGPGLAGNEVALQRAGAGGVQTFDQFMTTLRGMKTREEIDAFLKEQAGGEPQLLLTKAEHGAAALDSAVETAQASKTKERAPDAFADFANGHDSGNVHISAQKLMELYEKEGKVPSEGDGLFGWVPDIARKIQDGAATGGEVSIPVGDYIARVDPSVHTNMRDAVRLHDDGVTLEEAKEAQKVEPEAEAKPEPKAPETPEEQVKQELDTAKQALGVDTSVFMNMEFENAKALGITDAEFKAYSDKVARAEQHILDKAVAINRREIAKALTPEWKRNEARTRDEVTTEFKEQGVFAAERYLRQNKIELGGDNIDEVADGLAPLWGFESGADLRSALTELETVQAAEGLSVQQQLNRAIKDETARRMEEKHGSLAASVAKEAREIALADHTFDVLADEVRFLARAGGNEPPIGRQEMVDWAKQAFEQRNVKDAVSWKTHERAVARAGREAEKALLKGDFVEAFHAKQQQFLAAVWAKESAALAAQYDRVSGKIARFLDEETIDGIEQGYLEQLRQVLASVGLPQRFAPLADTPALRDFVTESEGQIAVAPWLMDGRQPKLQDMSVEQWRAFADSLKSLEHVGRKAQKLENARGEAEIQNVVFDIAKELERFPFIDQPNNPGFADRAKSFGRKIIGAHLLVERVLDYTDKFNPHGPLTEWLDRPLRDANTKEIVLTEQVTKMLRDLREHVDGSINDVIPNKLIPDALDKTGFLRMDRGNLRTLMLNMGNWSNMRKLVEGFGVNETDLRKFVNDNATAKDVAWVNGIWKVFGYLKPEADAVQLRDTGVPVDHIPPVPWEIAGGKLEGGYYPLSYDAYNSDIQGHIARPLFDRGYFAATTPHGYTQERTAYKGAIDLTGNFLASKIQGMVHDIAFREAVRNADKLIRNQEFRTAVAQHWGKEVLDLLPGWIRDIANSHNLDDNYARDFVRAASLVRQNVVSTLIAFNPGTFIKHGFTAAVMSADRVGAGALLGATREIGASGAAKNLKELVNRVDRLPDEDFMQSFRDAIDSGERGENARQFVMDSSAVMRNRQRQYEDTIKGAVDAITEMGVAKTLADFRQRSMLYGRLAVSFSDQMSAMPTWLAAYKKAYMAGEGHENAVFIADKEVSRAHGSNFVGDQPAVTRIGNSGPGEFARWFTGLYRFWNHQTNNLFQLVWDAAAALGGRSEPGANALSISRRVGQIMAIIAIEEMATAAKDEDHRGALARMIGASLRYFGGGFIGLREITNGLAHGYEPSTGMMGTLFKAGSDTVKDIARAGGVKAGVAKDWITHTATTLGFLTGVGGTQVGKTAQGITGVAQGRERPRTFNDWRQLVRTGHTKARVH